MNPIKVIPELVTNRTDIDNQYSEAEADFKLRLNLKPDVITDIIDLMASEISRGMPESMILNKYFWH